MEKEKMDSTPETDAPAANASEQPAEKNSGGNKMMLIIFVVIVLCCVITAGLFGLLFLLGDTSSSDSDGDRVITSDGNDVKEGAPTISDVEDAYQGLDSYSFEGEIDWGDGDVHQISGDFVSPNNEKYLTVDSIGTIEEVMLDGDTYFINYDEEGWEETEEPFNAGVQRDELEWILGLIDADVEGESISTGWTFSFYDEEYGEDWKLDVNDSFYPTHLRLEYVDDEGLTVVEEIYFDNFNDSDTEIVAPI